MSVKYVFNKGNERLFGTAYEFRNEAEKDQVLAALRCVLNEVTAVKSYASVQPFSVQDALARLRLGNQPEIDFQRLEQALAEVQRATDLREAQRRAQIQAHAEAETKRQQAAELARQQEQARRQELKDTRRKEAEQALALERQAAEQANKRDAARERVRQREQNRRAQQQAARDQARASVRERCLARNIQNLTHFTRLENVPSILTHGLISHAALNGRGFINDHARYDRRPHANCLSITSPNYRMFYKYRMENPGSQWAVLLLDPALLWELDCGFTEINAASSLASNRTDDEIRGPEAFELLFGNDAHRTKWRLTPSYPTNPQAEVLCFETVPPGYITAIHLQRLPQMTFRSGDGRVIPHTVADAHFRYRHDFEAWR